MCAIGLGSADFMGRSSSRAIGPRNALLGMLLSSALLVSLWVWVSDAPLVWRLADLWLVALNGAATTIMTVLLYWGLARGPVNVVAPIVAAHPVLVLLVYVVFAGIQPLAIQWVAMAATIVGVVMVAGGSDKAKDTDPGSRLELRITLLIALASSLAYAVLVIAGQAAVVVYGEVQTLWLGRLASLAMLFFLYGARRDTPHLSIRWWPFLTLQGMLDASAYLAFFAGSRGQNPEVAMVVASAFGVVTVLLAWVFLKERISAFQWLALVLVFGGVGVLAAHV
jgi:uncharacterized membrane protein